MAWKRIPGGFEWFGDDEFPYNKVVDSIDRLEDVYATARGVCRMLLDETNGIRHDPPRVMDPTIVRLSKWAHTRIQGRRELSRDIFVVLFGSYVPARIVDENDVLLPNGRNVYVEWANTWVARPEPPEPEPPEPEPPEPEPPEPEPPEPEPPEPEPPEPEPPKAEPNEVTSTIHLTAQTAHSGFVSVTGKGVTWLPYGGERVSVPWSRVCEWLETQSTQYGAGQQPEWWPDSDTNEHIRTRRLETYSQGYQQLAEQVFDRIALPSWVEGRDNHRPRNGMKCTYPGSYSISSRSGEGETLGKIVIYEKREPQREEGVHIWLRKNGGFTSRIDFDRYPVSRTFDDSHTMSVAPNTGEIFQVLHITEVTEDIVDLLTSLGRI